MYDVIIIGGGPAGLSAGIYSARYKLKTLIISKNIGGTAMDAAWVENYPGYEKISGFELMEKFKEQVKKLGVEIVEEAVEGFSKKDNHFEVAVKDKKFESTTVIVACGRQHKKLNIPGEEEFAGKGVSYCAVCDGPMFGDKIVGVVGGSDSAAKTALLLAEHAKKVYIIYRRNKLRAEPILVERIEKNPKIDVIYLTNIKEIKGETMIKKVIFDTGKELELDGLFIEAGGVPCTEIVKDIVKLDEKGYIQVDEDNKTSVKGAFAAGDNTNKGLNIRQIITAAAEGVIAATSAYEYLK